MNKCLDLGLSILEISKIVMYKFWYDNVEPKYGVKANLCQMNKDTFIVSIETEHIYSDIAKGVETGFDN